MTIGPRRATRVVHVLEATTGGTRRHLWDVTTGLDPARFRQTLIASPLRDDGFLQDVGELRRRGVEVRLLPMRRAPAPRGDLRAAGALVRQLRELRPDVVHTHSSKAGILGRWAARRAGVPRIVHTPHVFAFEMAVARVLRGLYLLFERRALGWTDALVCVSAAERRAAGRLGRRLPPAFVVPNGIATSGAPPPAPRLETPARIALLGRLCPQKGQDVLARALLRAPALARRGRFECVGVPAGAALPSAVRRAAASGLCHLLPALPPHAVPEYLTTVDVIVLPSRWEGMPYLLLEAMAARRCIVASAVGGVPEALRDGIEGRLVPPDDPAALAAALGDVLDAPDAARRRAQAAHVAVAERFRLDKMLDSLASIYETGCLRALSASHVPTSGDPADYA